VLTLECALIDFLCDTKVNGRKMEKVLERMELEVIAGTFDYAKFFPSSNYAGEFGDRSAVLPTPVRHRETHLM
jgi:integrase